MNLEQIKSFADWRWQNGFMDPDDAKNPEAQFEYQRYVQDTKTANDMVILTWQMAVKQVQDIIETSRKLI